ncbi:MAG: calcium-binding protein, partial [Alphaproteobacteria bacterium]
ATTTAGAQDFPSIHSLSDGGFVVSWQSAGQDGDGIGLYARLFGADGEPASAEFLVNQSTVGDQRGDFVNVTQLENGDLVFAWWGAGSDGNGVYTRRFDIPDSGGATPTPGDDVLTGTPGGDVMDLSAGGDDTVSGGAGDDGFFFGAAYTSGDVVDGGAGTLDQIGLQGDYAGGVTLGAITGVEMLVLITGTDNRFGGATGSNLSYAITATNASVAAGFTLAVQANTLRAGEAFTFNGAAELDGAFLTFGGLGTDMLTGGQQSDGFFFGIGRWGASDRVDGQGGTMDQLGLQGDYSGANAITFGASQLVSIETIALLSGTDSRFSDGGAGFDYDLTLADANVLIGTTFAINASLLQAGESLTLNASAESDVGITVFGGAGDDVLVLGRQDDRITGGGGADLLTGGLGDDRFIYVSAADSTASARDHILDFTLGDRIDLSAIDANSANGASTNDAFEFIGAMAFSAGVPGQLRAVSVNGIWTVEGDIDGDAIADFSIQVTAASLTAAEFIL